MMKLILLAVSLTLCCMSNTGFSQQTIGDVCRVRGQEDTKLQGVGLVVGLNGSGDENFSAISTVLTRNLAYAGLQVPRDKQESILGKDLSEVRNVAIVFVTATVPASGASRGEKVNCEVHAFGNAKSLKGGYLMKSPMFGGDSTAEPEGQDVLAFAEGRLDFENLDSPLAGKVTDGCSLVTSFKKTPEDVHVRFILDECHASLQNASEVAETINSVPDFRYNTTKGIGEEIAMALDARNILVRIPEKYAKHRVLFVSAVLGSKLYMPNAPRQDQPLEN